VSRFVILRTKLHCYLSYHCYLGYHCYIGYCCYPPVTIVISVNIVTSVTIVTWVAIATCYHCYIVHFRCKYIPQTKQFYPLLK
jgi:hypothetical protein